MITVGIKSTYLLLIDTKHALSDGCVVALGDRKALSSHYTVVANFSRNVINISQNLPLPSQPHGIIASAWLVANQQPGNRGSRV